MPSVLQRASLWAGSIFFSVAVLLTSGDSCAQPTYAENVAEAKRRYDEAVAAMEVKDYATACPALEWVVKAVPDGIGAKVTLAECYEESGHLASAWRAYLMAEEAATEAQQQDRRKRAKARAAALKPMLAELTIVVPKPNADLPGFALQRNGLILDKAQWDVPVPIDKGKVVVAATATGRERWETVVEIPLDGAKVRVEIPKLPFAKPAPAPERPIEERSVRLKSLTPKMGDTRVTNAATQSKPSRWRWPGLFLGLGPAFTLGHIPRTVHAGVWVQAGLMLPSFLLAIEYRFDSAEIVDGTLRQLRAAPRHSHGLLSPKNIP